jgi:L-threonylcarbamoyladenylate synthase
MPQIVDRGEIDRAARLLRSGRLVAFPTETVYGLGANSLDDDAVSRIYAVKRRPATSPLIVHVASLHMARGLVANWTESAERLAQEFWPGPLTLVLEKAHSFMSVSTMSVSTSPISLVVTAGLSTVGVRMPAHAVALALIQAANLPLAAPSANRFTEVSPTTAQHVRDSLGDEVDLILDGGPCQVGIESTVISLAEPVPTLLRAGGVSRQAVEAVLGPIVSAQDILPGAHPAPGMHPRHYSPKTPLHLSNDGSVPAEGLGIYLRYSRKAIREDIVIHQMPQSSDEYAAILYAILREADARGYSWIVVDAPPENAQWEAVTDRLKRAAAR